RLLREDTPWQSTLYVYEPGSYAPLARVDQQEGETAQKVYYFHTNQIGTPLEMTDVDGSIVWQATYKAWGEIEALSVNEVEQNLRFQGQYFDDETGLHYNTFRYYDPGVGRFITQDPIGLLGGHSLYKYANDPINWIDPAGLSSRDLRVDLGMKSGDMHAAHHIIPEEVMKKYPDMFDRAKSFGFKPDGASNGIELPRTKAMAQTLDLPGHWSNHVDYSGLVESDVAKLNTAFRAGRLSDMDLALGLKSIQNKWRSNILNKNVPINSSGRLC
ncbi:RHS domain-containing protein, partial [Pseudomonas sp. GD03842]|uniref:RHS repeat-associated core domain-containing protein n=1 Tax=Pseudomonas sp. GD03842 TaxID=2975385 RepID=UPI00244BA369